MSISNEVITIINLKICEILKQNYYYLVVLSCSKPLGINDEINGHSILVGTSGTFTGAGINAKWDRIVKEDGDFELFKIGEDSDELIASGRIKEKSIEESLYEIKVRKTITAKNLSLYGDGEKTIRITEDAMHWNAPCCDRVNFHLQKE